MYNNKTTTTTTTTTTTDSLQTLLQQNDTKSSAAETAPRMRVNQLPTCLTPAQQPRSQHSSQHSSNQKPTQLSPNTPLCVAARGTILLSVLSPLLLTHGCRIRSVTQHRAWDSTARASNITIGTDAATHARRSQTTPAGKLGDNRLPAAASTSCNRFTATPQRAIGMLPQPASVC